MWGPPLACAPLEATLSWTTVPNFSAEERLMCFLPPYFHLVSSLMNNSDQNHFFSLEFYNKHSENNSQNKHKNTNQINWALPEGFPQPVSSHTKSLPSVEHQDVHVIWPCSLSLYDKGGLFSSLPSDVLVSAWHLLKIASTVQLCVCV